MSMKCARGQAKSHTLQTDELCFAMKLIHYKINPNQKNNLNIHFDVFGSYKPHNPPGQLTIHKIQSASIAVRCPPVGLSIIRSSPHYPPTHKFCLPRRVFNPIHIYKQINKTKIVSRMMYLYVREIAQHKWWKRWIAKPSRHHITQTENIYV